MRYSHVDAGAHAQSTLEEGPESPLQPPGRRPKPTVVAIAAFAVVGGCLLIVGGMLASGLLRPAGGVEAEELRKLEQEQRGLVVIQRVQSECTKLWAQCGGEGYTGPTCCETGSTCQHFALEKLPSYHQCRRPNEVVKTCAEPASGSSCAKQIKAKKRDAGIHPEYYHGLTSDLNDREFQQFLHWAEPEESACPEPCSDGAGAEQCFFILHVEGCDTLDVWYCQHDDGSLKFACCCTYFHEEKALEKPVNPDPDMANAMQAVDSEEPSLFCTAMCMPHGYELPLLRAQYQKGKLGLFGCNAWAVYSNLSLILSPLGEAPAVMTEVIKGSLSAQVGGDWGTALNTDVFLRFWDRVLEHPLAWQQQWVVKVDPDTMWMPVRLRALLRTTHGPLGQKEPEHGIYLNNCHVGLHGPIEALSHRALRRYSLWKGECRKGKVSKIGQEDYFLRKCFDKLGILKVNAYNLMLEATLACQEAASAENPDRPPCFSPQVAFHPFKSEDTWMRCHHEAANHPWALPVIPVTDGPSEANNRHG